MKRDHRQLAVTGEPAAAVFLSGWVLPLIV